MAILLCGLSARSARAESPPENAEQSREPAAALSVAVLAGWSHGDEVGFPGYRTLFGTGARLGYSFAATPLYLGFTVVRYSDDIEHDDAAGVVGTEHLVHIDFDIGTELTAGPVIIRPYLGLGVLMGIYDEPGNGGSVILPELVPGLHVGYPIGPLEIGADARLELGWEKAAALLGNVGARF